MPLSLLFIEDNEDILLNLFSWFETKNYVCDCARDGKSGLELAKNGKFDCIVLDIILPRMNGIEVCHSLRKMGNSIPVIMLTAMDAVDDKIAGLESGADDYLVKPFSLKELEARIRAVCRRGLAESSKCQLGALILDAREHRAFRQGRELRLSPSGFRILELLMARAPGIAHREELEELLWGDDPPNGSALRNHMHEIRKVLDKPFDAPMLETVPHLGWRLNIPNS